eukprot:4620745-Karenia_brevis.AAC.1
MLCSCVKEFPSTLKVVEDLRAGMPVQGFDANVRAKVRQRWLATLHWPVSLSCPGPDADVLAAWGQASQDPDAAHILPYWLRNGAPMGILEPVDVANVFPSISSDAPRRNPDTLRSELAG